MPAGPDSPIRPSGNARPRNLAPSRLTARRGRPATNQNDPLGWTVNDNGWINRATERDHRGSEPTDQSGTVGPLRDRLACVARDDTPRNVPIIFTWNGSQIVMCTPKNAL